MILIAYIFAWINHWYNDCKTTIFKKIDWENIKVFPPPEINVVYLPFLYFPEATCHSETLKIGSGKGKQVVFLNILSSIEA